MKKVVLNYLVIVALVGSATFTSCDKDGDTMFTVAFNSKGGSAVSAQIVKKGTKVNKPTDPTRDKYDFAGWATADNASSSLWDFEKSTVEEDMILYARWEAGEEEPDPDPDPDPVEYSPITSISATNMSGMGGISITQVRLCLYNKDFDGDNDYFLLPALATTGYSNGFSFTNLPTPPPGSLVKFVESDFYISGITISDNTTKLGFAGLFGFRNNDWIGEFLQAKMTEDHYDIQVLYFYVDKDVTVTGSVSFTEGNFKETLTWHAGLKAGWNNVYMIGEDTATTWTALLTTKAPTETLSWYFEENGDYNGEDEY